jgi:NAD+ synthase (glutamine-hydrolysing)
VSGHPDAAATGAHPFWSPAAHGIVRVAAATPRVAVGDPAANAAAILELAVRAHDEAVDLVVYPELSLSSYAIDDLHLQAGQQRAVDAALATVVAASADLHPLLLVGAPVPDAGRLYNCALAVHRGRLLAVVPKQFLPNHREYYERRWFQSGVGVIGRTLRLLDQDVPFGTDLVLVAEDRRDLVVGVEICEDMWAPTPPSGRLALAGATVLANLSASNVTIGKARDRALLCAAQSLRTYSAYVFSAAGPGESTTDMAWDGQGLVHELGDELAASPRFAEAAELLVADVDATRVALERLRTPTYGDAGVAEGRPEAAVRRIPLVLGVPPAPGGGAQPDLLRRDVAPRPFVPDDAERLDEDCYEAFNIQVDGLTRRLAHTGSRTLVIGVSGGIDSTHALIVAARAMDRLGRPRSDIHGVTMPGFATSEGTRGTAWRLMEAMGVHAEEIDIRPAANQMLTDLDHPYSRGEPVHDVTFENVQAGLRTDYLFRIANHRRGIVLGTGDLSEMALGWATYGVGDQMSHYAVNVGVPKTLIRHLIRWAATSGELDEPTSGLLLQVLDAVVSPELVPADAEGKVQSTEEQIGPYDLHDFFLHHLARAGQAPSKVAYLAWQAWHDTYDLPTIVRWLELFLRRFYGFAQFKRSAVPNGPKVSGAGALSPRADWRAPSDATAAPYLAELRAALPDGVAAG